MNFFDNLLETNVPVDWTTLLLGWDGLDEWNRMVTTKQLQSYAMDQIGYGPESEFELVSGIAFAEARHLDDPRLPGTACLGYALG